MKRLRKKAGTPGIRFYVGGEYGERYRRPHFHACLFGYDFNDKVLAKKTRSGFQLYRSPTLEKLWPYGFSSIGDVTFESAAYIARYVMKKITGDKAEKHYEKLNEETGEIEKLKPEFNQMSRRPGIGLSWLKKYTADVYPEGKVIMRGGASMNPPRFYDKQYKKEYPSEYELMKFYRQMEAIERWRDNTQNRLNVKETIEKARLKMLKRTID